MKVESESEVAQSCPTISDPMDCSIPGSSVHGIFQARALEWGAIAFSDVYNMEEPKATVGSKLAHLFQEAQTHQLPKVLASRETLEVGFRDGFFTKQDVL